MHTFTAGLFGHPAVILYNCITLKICVGKHWGCPPFWIPGTSRQQLGGDPKRKSHLAREDRTQDMPKLSKTISLALLPCFFTEDFRSFLLYVPLSFLALALSSISSSSCCRGAQLLGICQLEVSSRMFLESLNLKVVSIWESMTFSVGKLQK